MKRHDPMSLDFMPIQICSQLFPRNRAHETAMSGCWALLGDILAEAKAGGIRPAPATRFTEALLQGG